MWRRTTFGEPATSLPASPPGKLGGARSSRYSRYSRARRESVRSRADSVQSLASDPRSCASALPRTQSGHRCRPLQPAPPRPAAASRAPVGHSRSWYSRYSRIGAVVRSLAPAGARQSLGRLQRLQLFLGLLVHAIQAPRLGREEDAVVRRLLVVLALRERVTTPLTPNLPPIIPPCPPLRRSVMGDRLGVEARI